MKIAIASGKGGTGKTTVAVNLAVVWAGKGGNVAYMDCDVEEPNGHLFLKPKITKSKTISVLVPEVDAQLCDGCGECGKICNFSAIVVLAGKPLTFPELCHSCGGCSLVCPPKAITEIPRKVGVLDFGHAGGVAFVGGRLRIGEAQPGPLIREVKRSTPESGHTIIDAPPGTSCPVVETIKGTDLVLLVTEPTPFGLNDLKLAVEMVQSMGLPLAVVLNRAGSGYGGVNDFCCQEGIDIIAEIPDDRRIAEVYSRGELVIEALRKYRPLFEDMLSAIEKKARLYEAAAG